MSKTKFISPPDASRSKMKRLGYCPDCGQNHSPGKHTRREAVDPIIKSLTGREMSKFVRPSRRSK